MPHVKEPGRQNKAGREAFRAPDDGGDRLRPDRVQNEEERREQRQHAVRKELLQKQKDQDAVQGVNQNVGDVIAGWVFAAQGVVYGVAQHDDRAIQPSLALDRLPVVLPENLLQMGRVQAVYYLIALDDDGVVENKPAIDGVRI